MTYDLTPEETRTANRQAALDTEQDRLTAYRDKHGYLALYDYLHGWPRDELIEAVFELLGFWEDAEGSDGRDEA